jgi:hypothetical protein
MGVLFIEQAHQLQVLLTFPGSLVVVARPSEIQEVALPYNAHIWMIGIDQRPFLFKRTDPLFFSRIAIFPKEEDEV